MPLFHSSCAGCNVIVKNLVCLCSATRDMTGSNSYCIRHLCNARRFVVTFSVKPSIV